MRITLHIGTEKTGTSTIQSFLKQSAGALYEQGVLVPNALRQNGKGDTHLALAAMFCSTEERMRLQSMAGKRDAETEAAYRDRIFDALAKEVREAREEGRDRLLISSEHLSSRLRTTQDLESLKAFLEEFGTVEKVIVYLRRQDKFLVSSFSTELKSGRVQPFNIPNPNWARHRYDYQHLLSLWSEVFGESTLCVRPFEKHRFVDNDLVKDFFVVAGLDYPGGIQVVERNPMLDLAGMAIMLRFNHWVRDHGMENQRELRRKLVTRLDRRPQGPKMQLSGEEALEFVKRYEKQNMWVSEKYLGGEPLFTEKIDPLQEERKPPEYAGDALFELLFELLYELDNMRVVEKHRDVVDFGMVVNNLKRFFRG